MTKGKRVAQRKRSAEKFVSQRSGGTRDNIIKAARIVFTEHPYKAASVRMIGKEGGFDHPLINYYFPSKAALFEAVVAQICEEFCDANISWFDGLERMRPRDGLPLYLDRLIEFNRNTPEPLKIILLNCSQIDKLEEIPGYQHIPETLAKARRTFEDKVPLRADANQIEKFIFSFNSLLVYYLGAAPCQAAVLGMKSASAEYYKWVKETMVSVFLPLLEKLISG